MGGVRIITNYELRITSEEGEGEEGPELTEGMVAILGLLARGYSIRGAAAGSCYSVVHTYELLREARGRLGVGTNTGAVVVAVGLGLIGLPAPEEVVGSDE